MPHRYGNFYFDIICTIFILFLRPHAPYMCPTIRHAPCDIPGYPTWCPCSLDADWCLRSDDVPHLRVFRSKARTPRTSRALGTAPASQASSALSQGGRPSRSRWYNAFDVNLTHLSFFAPLPPTLSPQRRVAWSTSRCPLMRAKWRAFGGSLRSNCALQACRLDDTARLALRHGWFDSAGCTAALTPS